MSAKLFALLLFAASLHVSANTTAQQVTLHLKNAPLTKLFAEIKKQTGYVFFFKEGVLAEAKPVTVDFKGQPLEEVLQQALKDQHLGYSIEGKTINVFRKTTSGATITPPPTEVAAPPATVHGRVTNENGEPVVGVSISVKGGKIIGVTDNNGEFRLNNVADNATLVFSAVTIETFEVRLNGRSELALNAKVKTNELDEVVVNKGYYTTSQRLNTGNVSRVKGEDIRKQPVSDPLLALEGRVPGLFISQASGIPGAYSNVQLRGQNFIPGATRDQYIPTLNSPLYIVDGIPFNSGALTISSIGGGAIGSPGLGNNSGLSPFNNLNPADIESIDVLKDADATAIYGSRGANGVILISTRKGKSGKTKLDIEEFSGFSKVAKMIPLMNTQQYLEMRKEAFSNDGKNPGATDLDLNGTWDVSKYTDWQKMFIGGTAHFTKTQLSLTGGNQSTQFFLSGGFSNQSTVFPGAYFDKKQFLSFNVNHLSANKAFHAMFSGSYVKDNNELPQSDLTNYIQLSPNAPDIIDVNGNLNWNLPFNNPLSYLKGTAMALTENLISNLNLDYEILPGLHAKTSLGYSNIKLNQTNITPAISFPPPFNTDANFRVNDWGTNTIETWIAEPQINYARAISKGKLDLLAGATFQENLQNAIGQEASGFSSDDLIRNVALATTVSIRSTANSKYHYSAVYGRINYNLLEKYIINVTLRRDGSSRFGPGKQFGNFGAVGAAWVFSNEIFLQKRLPFISFGKLRTSYGVTGNDQISDYKYLSTYQPYTASNYQGILGVYPTQIGNSYFGWQTVKKLEIGLDLGFFRDRISLNASYYRNRTDDQLVGYALPSTTGFTTIFANLPATVQNSGTEIALSSRNIQHRNFTWSTAFNISIPRNKLVSYPNISSSAYATKYQLEKSLYIKYLYHAIGVNSQTGIYQIEDADQSSSVNAADKQFLKSVSQEYYGGLQNNFSFNGIQLDFLVQFVKQTGYNYANNFTQPGSFNSGVNNQPSYVLNRWQKPGDNAEIQKYTQQSGATFTAWANAISTGTGDGTITDASFLRLKNVSLSYDLPAMLIKKLRVSGFKIYIQAQNLVTITNYEGLDPETQGLALPPLRTITFGGRISF